MVTMGSQEAPPSLTDKEPASLLELSDAGLEEAAAAAAAAAAKEDGDEGVPSLKIDPCFIVPAEHRRSRPHTASQMPANQQIPVVDLGPLHTGSADDASVREALAAQVGSACEEWGFFQVINHGVPRALIQSLKDEAKAFFELPLLKKLEVKRTSESFLGYNDGELTKNVRDWKEVFDMAHGGSYQLPADFDGDALDTVVHSNNWPSFMPSLRKVCEEYMSTMEGLAFTLLELIAQSLGLPPNRFHEEFKTSTTSLFRLNYYPICPAPELALGVSRHKDGGALTILLQDEVGGLEVRKDGEWIGVKPDPQAFVINVGDVMQVYSNDKYQSVEHRVVVNENLERYSFPFFFSPAHWVDLFPLSELTDDQHPPRYRPFNWGKYFKRRNDSNYKNLGVENLQIYHYSINV